MITQRHGRKLASQLGEVLFLCQFYDLQIETKVSLSLRNFVVALSVCVCVCSFLHNGITPWMKIIPVWPEGPASVPHQSGWEYIQAGLYWYIILGLAVICRKMYSKHRAQLQHLFTYACISACISKYRPSIYLTLWGLR